MSRNGKIAVAVVAGVLVLFLGLCACACASVMVFHSGDGRASRMSVRTEIGEPAAADVVGYAIPEGFVAGEGGGVFGVRWAEMHPAGSDGHIMLVTAPRELGLSTAAIREVAEHATDWNVSDRNGNAIATDTIDVTIRGEAVTLVRGRGVNHDGDAFQTLTGVFEGRDGPVLLSIVMLADEWDQAAVDTFLASIE